MILQKIFRYEFARHNQFSKAFRCRDSALAVICILISNSVLGQNSYSEKSFFQSRSFGQYFLADHYAPFVKVGIGTTIGLAEYDLGNRGESFWFAEPTVGAQMPIYSSEGPISGFALSIPVSFSVWFDFAEPRTAPILNTDYRFALLELNYYRNINNSFIRNLGIRVIPFFHESTHLGDEITLYRVKHSIPTTRINVSYESFEFAVLINDPYLEKVRNHSFRVGAKFLYRPEKGYYTTDSLEVLSDVEIQPSKRWIEPYFQYQFQNPNGWLSNDKMMFVFSADLSLRVRFGYPVYSTDQSGNTSMIDEGREEYKPSINTLFGWKLLNSKKENSDLGVFLKLYYGINPHGQFRNIPFYPWFGLTLIYEL